MNKILIIEDDQIVANIYRNKFAIEGYDVEIACDGLAGLETIKNFKPDAVVLDLMLPKMTGVDLMKKVRSEPEFQKLPIIVFSNTYLTNMVQEAWKAGATKCLSKANCSPKQLLEVVRSTLASKGPPNAGPTTAPPERPQAGAANLSEPAAPSPLEKAHPGQDPDAQFQAELRKEFLRGVPTTLSTIRASLQALIKTPDEASRIKNAGEMYRRIHALTSNAGITGMLSLAQMSDALEALLKELFEKPKNFNTSTLRTVASAVDLLGTLSTQNSQLEIPTQPAPRVLVVDDEAISRRAVTYALERDKQKSTVVENSQAAFDLLLENRFDLVFLDVDMPGMNGFELCAKLRMLPAHKKTPVVFVTSLNDLEARANSTMSGGNDFIAKPFLFIELTVKALVYLLRGRMTPAK